MPAHGVGIFQAQQEDSLCLPRQQEIEKRGADIAEVQQTRGAGAKRVLKGCEVIVKGAMLAETALPAKSRFYDSKANPV